MIRNAGDAVPSLARLSRYSSSLNASGADQNGLWHCRVQTIDGNLQEVVDNFVYVAMYQRGRGEWL